LRIRCEKRYNRQRQGGKHKNQPGRESSQGTQKQQEYTKTNAEENRHSQQAGIASTTEQSIKGCVRPILQLPPCSLCEQQHAKVAHATLTLYKGHAHFPVGPSKKKLPSDRKRACCSYSASGTNLMNEGSVKMPARLRARMYKSVPGVQISRVRMILAPVAQSDSNATCLGQGGAT
jgi:hypothetical protein